MFRATIPPTAITAIRSAAGTVIIVINLVMGMTAAGIQAEDGVLIIPKIIKDQAGLAATVNRELHDRRKR